VSKLAPGAFYQLTTGLLNTPLSDKSLSLFTAGLLDQSNIVKQIAFQAPLPRFADREPTFDILPEQYEILHQFHNAHTGHPGAEATIYALKGSGHHWKYMRAHVQQFISRCRTCLLSRIRHLPAGSLNSTLRLTDKPFSRWHADMTGSYKTCKSTGYEYIVVFICEVTGLAMLYGSRMRCALEIAIALLQLCGIFGPAEAFHSDGGSEFDAVVVNIFSRIMALKKTLSIAANPNTNGIAESNIKMVKRVFRQLVTDIGKFQHWGLNLPVTQWATNSTYRHAIGCSPNEFLFPTYAQRTETIIPVGILDPSRLNESVFADLNHWNLPANFIHQVKTFQESVLARLSEFRIAELTRAAAIPALPVSFLQTGQQVLIPWNWSGAPLPDLPLMRGPYVIMDKHPSSNVLSLRHVQFPPPRGQPVTLQWSTHAHAYPVDIPDRSELDPSASAALPFETGAPIDFILEHKHPDRWPSGRHITNVHHVNNFEFLVQLYGIPKTNPAYRRWLPYDQVRHTVAIDNYVLTNPELEGHSSILNMPAGWDAHAPTIYPAHDPLALDELDAHFHEIDPDPP